MRYLLRLPLGGRRGGMFEFTKSMDEPSEGYNPKLMCGPEAREFFQRCLAFGEPVSPQACFGARGFFELLIGGRDLSDKALGEKFEEMISWNKLFVNGTNEPPLMPFVERPNIAALESLKYKPIDEVLNEPKKKTLELELFYDDQEKTPAGDTPYKITFSNNQVIKGTLDERGLATIPNTPDLPAKVEFGDEAAKKEAQVDIGGAYQKLVFAVNDAAEAIRSHMLSSVQGQQPSSITDQEISATSATSNDPYSFFKEIWQENQTLKLNVSQSLPDLGSFNDLAKSSGLDPNAVVNAIATGNINELEKSFWKWQERSSQDLKKASQNMEKLVLLITDGMCREQLASLSQKMIEAMSPLETNNIVNAYQQNAPQASINAIVGGVGPIVAAAAFLGAASDAGAGSILSPVIEQMNRIAKSLKSIAAFDWGAERNYKKQNVLGWTEHAVGYAKQRNKAEENWVELELVDQDSQPVPNEEFIIIDAFARHNVAQGVLDQKGKAHVSLPKNTAHVEVIYPNVEDNLPENYFIQSGESNQDYSSRIWEIFTKHRVDKNFTECNRILSAIKQEAGLSDPIDFNNPTQVDADYLAQIQNLRPGAWDHPAMEKTGKEVSSPPVNMTLFMGPGYKEYYCRKPGDHGLAFKSGRERLQEPFVLNEIHLKMEKALGESIRHARTHADPNPLKVIAHNPDSMVDAIGMSMASKGIGGGAVPVKPKGSPTAPRRRQTGLTPIRAKGESKSTVRTKVETLRQFGSLNEALNVTESRIVGRPYETGFIITPDGQVIAQRSAQRASKNIVKFSENEREMMKGNIVTHNHPSGNTLGPEDLSIAIGHQAKGIRAVGEEKTYIMEFDYQSSSLPTTPLGAAGYIDGQYKKAGMLLREDFQAGKIKPPVNATPKEMEAWKTSVLIEKVAKISPGMSYKVEKTTVSRSK